MYGKVQFPVESNDDRERGSLRRAMIEKQILSKKQEMKPDSKLGLSELLKPKVGISPIGAKPMVTTPEKTQGSKDDVMKLMTSSAKDVGKFIAKPSGMRALAMFMKPDAAVLVNKKADQMEMQEAQRSSKKYKPEYIKGVGVFDPNTKKVDPSTTPKSLGLPTLEPEEQFKQEGQLRDKFQALTKDYRTIRDSYSRVKVSGTNPSAAGDLALIFNYMKMLDPGSVVRESEFANAAATGAYGERMKAAGLKIIKGERLSPAMRNDFMSRSNSLFKTRDDQYLQTSGEYKKLAKDYGLESSRVVLKLGIPKTKLTGKDLEAYNWAKSNPDDPRSNKIMAKLNRVEK